VPRRARVPIRKIIDRWGHSIANAASVAADVDRFYVYDKSVDDRGAQRRLVEAFKPARAPHEVASPNGDDHLAATAAGSTPKAAE